MSLEQEQWVDPAPLILQSWKEIGKLGISYKIEKQLKAVEASICMPASPLASKQLKWRGILSMCSRQGA